MYHCGTLLINTVLTEAGVARRWLTVNTPIERRLHDALMVAGVGFTTQRRLVGRYIVDISINQAPVVIEADGVWHRIGTKAQEHDAVRDAAHEAAGYQVFRFTGSEINTDAVKCIQVVIDACGLVPDEEPVYDIRTSFRGPDHPSWKANKELTLICEYCGTGFTALARRRFCSRAHAGRYLSENGVVSAVSKGMPKPAAFGAKIAEINRRRVFTAETRAKISASRRGKPTTKGRPVSPETRARISAALMGHRQSDETRAKKSAAHLGTKMDEATRAKISAALKGKPKSAEHRAKLSASRKRSDQIVIEPDPA